MYFVITQNTRSERSRGVHDLKPESLSPEHVNVLRNLMKREALLWAPLEGLGRLRIQVYQGYTPDEKHM